MLAMVSKTNDYHISCIIRVTSLTTLNFSSPRDLSYKSGTTVTRQHGALEGGECCRTCCRKSISHIILCCHKIYCDVKAKVGMVEPAEAVAAMK